ncbi:MAG: hypothetical protein HFG35_08195 [Eubacterium sp.]|nr:hypothetical protein [Eubacterium sp.]
MNSKAGTAADMSPIKYTVTDPDQIYEIETISHRSSLDRLRAYIPATSHVFGTKAENCPDNT